METGAFGGSHYVLKRQLLKLIGGAFRIYDEGGTQVVQANQKGFKLKADIRLLVGPELSQEVVGIFARSVFGFSAAYDVVDLTSNAKIGAFRRKGFKSLVRDEWEVLDANDMQVGVVIEDSLALGLVRRFLTNLVPQNYDLLVGGTKVADLKQTFNPFNYNLHIDFHVAGFDRRMGLAAGVLLAAIEGKQGREG